MGAERGRAVLALRLPARHINTDETAEIAIDAVARTR
jgi:hypothetical protein